MRTRRLLSLVVSFLPACGQEQRLAQAGPAEALAGTYSWRAGAAIPWWGEPAERLPFGELGRTPATRLYLTFNAKLEQELAAQQVAWSATGKIADAAGHFGGGLKVGRGELRLGLGAEALAARQWTVECWVRPAEESAGAFLALSGLFSARCDAQGHLIVQTPGSVKDPESLPRPTLVKSNVPLEREQWNHVGIVLDLVDTHSLRVVVNGAPRARKLESELDLPREAELLLGGSGKVLACTLDELRLQARAANTEEFVDAQAGPRPLERLRLSRGGETEEREVWWSFVRTPVLATAADWQQGELERVVADERGLRRVNAHWRRIDAVDPPVARTTHATAFLGAHRILLFGGETRDSHAPPMRNTDDTWLFDTLAETWRRLAPGLAPSGRCHQAAAYCPERDVVLLGGGFNIESWTPQLFSDTWLYHVNEGRWERCETKDTGGFSDDGVVYHAARKLFVSINGPKVRTFDPHRAVWRELPEPAVVDEQGRALERLPAGSMTAGYDPTSGTILLFGGTYLPRDDEQYVDDVYLYDLDANRMTLLAPAERPAPRVRGALGWDAHQARFVLFGGVRSQRSQRMDDLWSFDPRTRRWTEQASDHAPSERGGYYGLEYDPELERFFLLCGRNAHERFLSEAWTLSLDERAPGRARCVFDRSSFPAATHWFAEIETSGDARVEFRFRASADTHAWSPWSASPEPEGRFLQVEATLLPGAQGEQPRVKRAGFREDG